MFSQNNPMVAAIISAGMKCLRDTLGTFETEVFISNIKQETFDYTEWRQSQPWMDISHEDMLERLSASDQKYKALIDQINKRSAT